MHTQKLMCVRLVLVRLAFILVMGSSKWSLKLMLFQSTPLSILWREMQGVKIVKYCKFSILHWKHYLEQRCLFRLLHRVCPATRGRFCWGIVSTALNPIPVIFNTASVTSCSLSRVFWTCRFLFSVKKRFVGSFDSTFCCVEQWMLHSPWERGPKH